MAFEDSYLPVSTDLGFIPDKPIAPTKGSETAEQEAMRSIMASTIKAANDGVRFGDAFAGLMSAYNAGQERSTTTFYDKLKDESNRQVDEIANLAKSEFQNRYSEFFGDQPENGIQVIQQLEADANSQKADPTTPYMEWAQAQNVGAFPLGEDDLKRLAYQKYFEDQILDVVDDVDLADIMGDILIDIATLGIKPLVDMYQGTGTINGLTVGQVIEKMRDEFLMNTPERQLELFPVMFDQLKEVMPESRAAILMQAIVSPSGQADAEFDFGLFGTLDLGFLLGGAAATLIRLRKLRNAAKVAEEVGDLETGTDITMNVLRGTDEGMGLGPGINQPRITGTTSASGFAGVDDAAAPGLAPGIHESIFQFRDMLEEGLGGLREGRTMLQEGFLDSTDQAKAVGRLTDEWDRYVKDTFQGKSKPTNIDMQITADGVRVKFDIIEPNGAIKNSEWTGRFVTDDIGMYRGTVKDNVLGSAKQQAFGTTFFDTVNAAIRLDNTSAAVGTQFRKLFKEATKSLRSTKGFRGLLTRKQKLKDVEDVLLAGDDLGKVFTIKELRQGVNGVRLDDDAIGAYYKVRALMDGMWWIRNASILKGLRARGAKEIAPGGEAVGFGEVAQTAAQASQRMAGRRRTFFFNRGKEGDKVNVSDLDFDLAYANGWRLVRLEQDLLRNGERFKHILVHNEDLRELPMIVTQRHEGYVPRVNPKGLYFVQAVQESSVDGIAGTTTRAIRSFSTEKEALEYASKLEADRVINPEKVAKELKIGEGTKLKVVRDREAEALRVGDSGVGSVRGLVHSPRARNRVPHGPEGETEFPRLAALESMELYLENTKNFVTRNEWRMGMIRKWEKTAQYELGRPVSFDNPGQALANEQLQRLHERISHYAGLMDKSERAWEERMTNLYEFATSKFGKDSRISEFMLNHRLTDPGAVVRSVTFHSMLGAFNPIQWWVQAQGAAVAMSINITNPVRLQKVFRQMHGLAAVQHMDVLKKAPDWARKMGKATGYKDLEELSAMKQLWDKSGFYDSTLLNADLASSARGFPTTQGGIKEFFQTGLMFFRAGELFNRRMAFLTAIDELGGAAKVAKNDVLFKEALERANNLVLNLGRANRAQFQKGLLSVPTQFMQIQTKTAEAFLGNAGILKPAERWKMLLGQVLLYGSAGLPLGQMGLRFMTDMTNDQLDLNDPNRTPEELIAFANGGFTDLFFNLVNADVTGGERGSLINGLDQTIFSFFTDEQTLMTQFMGPSGVPPGRFFQKLREMSVWFNVPRRADGTVDITAQQVTDNLRRFVMETPELAGSWFSTTSQITKFMLMQDLGQIRNTKGQLISQGDHNWQTEWATLIGFKPNELQLNYDLSERNQAYTEYVRLRADMLVRESRKFLGFLAKHRQDGTTPSEEDLQEWYNRNDFLRNTISPDVRREVQELYESRLRAEVRGEGSLDRQMQRYWDNLMFDLSGEVPGRGGRLFQLDDAHQTDEE
jgi:hypothetical protein